MGQVRVESVDDLPAGRNVSVRRRDGRDALRVSPSGRTDVFRDDAAAVIVPESVHRRRRREESFGIAGLGRKDLGHEGQGYTQARGQGDGIAGTPILGRESSSGAGVGGRRCRPRRGQREGRIHNFFQRNCRLHVRPLSLLVRGDRGPRRGERRLREGRGGARMVPPRQRGIGAPRGAVGHDGTEQPPPRVRRRRARRGIVHGPER
mmetsp:Transcript_5944/g.17147  ORF Transcript_5944/g.17147 Transcript_5944/m.17147 type:complete len:206 (-) Transcript_5944:353-970(-)